MSRHRVSVSQGRCPPVRCWRAARSKPCAPRNPSSRFSDASEQKPSKSVSSLQRIQLRLSLWLGFDALELARSGPYLICSPGARAAVVHGRAQGRPVLPRGRAELRQGHHLSWFEAGFGLRVSGPRCSSARKRTCELGAGFLRQRCGAPPCALAPGKGLSLGLVQGQASLPLVCAVTWACHFASGPTRPHCTVRGWARFLRPRGDRRTVWTTRDERPVPTSTDFLPSYCGRVWGGGRRARLSDHTAAPEFPEGHRERAWWRLSTRLPRLCSAGRL